MDIANLDKKVNLTDGEWIDDIPDQPGLRLKVRSTNYKPFRESAAEVARRAGKKLNTGKGIVDFTDNTGGPLADHILLDWDMAKWSGEWALTSKGKPIKYSPEAAKALIVGTDDHGYRIALRAAVEWAGNRVADKLRETTREAEGN